MKSVSNLIRLVCHSMLASESDAFALCGFNLKGCFQILQLFLQLRRHLRKNIFENIFHRWYWNRFSILYRLIDLFLGLLR